MATLILIIIALFFFILLCTNSFKSLFLVLIIAFLFIAWIIGTTPGGLGL